MKLYLLRHGLTEYNAQQRYQGTHDLPLSPEGEAALVSPGFAPEVVYVSPMRRVRRTAELWFPEAKQVVIDELREMSFGVYEGRTYQEAAADPIFRSWLFGDDEGVLPEGESRAAFAERTCAVFERLVNEALAAGKEELVIVAHGGTQMVIMDRFALPKKRYYKWLGPNAGGYILDMTRWEAERLALPLEQVCYAKEG